MWELYVMINILGAKTRLSFWYYFPLIFWLWRITCSQLLFVLEKKMQGDIFLNEILYKVCDQLFLPYHFLMILLINWLGKSWKEQKA